MEDREPTQEEIDKMIEENFDNATPEEVEKMIELVNAKLDSIPDIYCMGRMWPLHECKAMSEDMIIREIVNVVIPEYHNIHYPDYVTLEQRIKSVVLFILAIKKDTTFTDYLHSFDFSDVEKGDKDEQ